MAPIKYRATLFILVVSITLAQSPTPAFEVASVKPSIPGTTGGQVQFLPGGKFRATNVPLHFLIQEIYKVRNFQVAGDQHWMSIIADGYSSRYEIQGEGDSSATEAQVREMVKGLLAERFQLKVHKETRDLPVYALIPAKTGIKLQAAKDNGGGHGTVAFMVRGWIQGSNLTIPTLISALSELVDRPVVDKTNFADAFDFKLTFTPESHAAQEHDMFSNGDCPASFATFQEQRRLKPEPASCPSIFTAVQEQLGLKLNPQKAPIEVLVIDHVERPSAN